jgi:hypothetical protein
MVKEFRSALTVVDKEKNRTVRGLTKVNAPFSYGGYTFYQAGYDDTNLRYSSLDVVRDPGAGIVFFGFILLNAGLIMVFVPKLGITFGRRARKS